jgi:putative ABC transport system ATP-binding protein
VLQVDRLTKCFRSGERLLTVVDDITFSLGLGETCSVLGPSGSGKTTLLGLCAGLDRPTSGSVLLDGRNLGDLNQDGLADLRNRSVGFVFQTFQLVPTLTALENILVPLELRGEPGKDWARELLRQVGLEDRAHHYPVQLSGGEQQRIGLARAFVNRPRILFADEPTGNLDADTGEKVIELLLEMNREFGTTLLVVTHDLELSGRTRRILTLKGGRIISDRNSDSLPPPEPVPEQTLSGDLPDSSGTESEPA